MAFPVHANSLGTIRSTAASSITVNFPTGIVAGDLILVQIRPGGTPNINTPSGWWRVVYSTVGGRTFWFAKTAVGGETSQGFTFSSAFMSVATAHRITGWRGALNSTSVQGVFAATSSNVSPAFTPSGWGSEDILWIRGFTGVDPNAWWPTGTPSQFTLGASAVRSATHTNFTYPRAHSAFRYLRSSSIAASLWNVSVAQGGVVQGQMSSIIAIRPLPEPTEGTGIITGAGGLIGIGESPSTQPVPTGVRWEEIGRDSMKIKWNEV